MTKDQKKKEMEAWAELLKSDEHWDFSYLIDIIRLKLKFMEEWYRSDDPCCEGAIDKADQIASAIDCLDILRGDDDILQPLALDRLTRILHANMLSWWD